MKQLHKNLFLIAITLAAALITGCGGSADAIPTEIRVAYFANLTHVQPLVGLKQGTFKEELGDVAIKALTFNAGPSEIEALFAGEVDIGYIGPGPAINGYTKSNGEALRIVAGAVSGGAAMVVRPEAGIKGPADFHGKKLASPQPGNTQDVALRHYLQANGLKTIEQGGDVTVISVNNPDILTLFQRKELDGAWVPEPWATRLINESGTTLLLDERDLWPEGKFPTTIVIVRKEFLDKHPDLVDRWLRAHLKVTQWVREHPDEAKTIVRDEIKVLTGATIADAVIAESFSRMEVVDDPMTEAVKQNADHAYALGFLGDKQPNLTSLVDTKPLERARAGAN